MTSPVDTLKAIRRGSFDREANEALDAAIAALSGGEAINVQLADEIADGLASLRSIDGLMRRDLHMILSCKKPLYTTPRIPDGCVVDAAMVERARDAILGEDRFAGGGLTPEAMRAGLIAAISPGEPTFAPEVDLDEARVLEIARRIGYGRVIQLAEEEWARVDPPGNVAAPGDEGRGEQRAKPFDYRKHYPPMQPDCNGRATTGQTPEDWIERAARCAEEILQCELADIPAREESKSIEHLAWMAMKLAAKDVGSATKTCRWLGYLQGALVTFGYSTLETEKKRNLRSVAPPAAPREE